MTKVFMPWLSTNPFKSLFWLSRILVGLIVYIYIFNTHIVLWQNVFKFIWCVLCSRCIRCIIVGIHIFGMHMNIDCLLPLKGLNQFIDFFIELVWQMDFFFFSNDNKEIWLHPFVKVNKILVVKIQRIPIVFAHGSDS